MHDTIIYIHDTVGYTHITIRCTHDTIGYMHNTTEYTRNRMGKKYKTQDCKGMWFVFNVHMDGSQIYII